MRITKGQLGLAAIVVLAPGGFLLGATWLANNYRKRRATSVADAAAAEPDGPVVS